MRRLLCLFACLAAWCGLMAASPVAAQNIIERLITPGPLAAAHADLENNCNACHTSFQRAAQNAQCLDCHDEVRADISRRRKFHGRFDQARTRECRTCHSDHQGRNYALVRFNRERFDHSFTDYPLEGGHRAVACASCHRGNRNFRGTTATCATCHHSDDPHLGRLGRQCQECHQVAGWQQLRPFDHRAQAGFVLSGAHATTTCTACHRGQVWRGLASECIDCHRADDTHRGARGTACASCHRTTAWSAVTFDHSSTGFPLIGGHAVATCQGCHGAGNARTNPPQDCNACHAADDTHHGANGPACADCHTTARWTQVRFDHDRQTQFPLRGGHRQATCAACHRQPAREVKPPVDCIGCHRADDTHEGRNGESCARCHTEEAWDQVDFDHATMTQFPLTGAHAAVACETCHTAPPEQLHLSGDCADCHADEDPHQGALGPRCAQCHDSQSWTTRVRFDHDLGRFPLLGRHAQAQCSACHADKRFAASGTACADCHVDDHHAGTLGTPSNCRSCHNASNWTAWSFDHDRQTDFPLTGQHQGLVCTACHSRPGDPGQAPDQCAQCHARDDRHRGQFGNDCARCHVTSSFADIVLPN